MTARPLIVGVMGGGKGRPKDLEDARQLGTQIALRGWVLLNGGRNTGIMEASARGARESGGLTIGVLPDSDACQVSRYIDIPIITGMGQARNTINVLTSHVVVACPGGAGTMSEISLALKLEKPVALLHYQPITQLSSYRKNGRLVYADSVASVIEWIARLFP